MTQEQRAAAGAARSGRTARVRTFFRDSWLELQKVIWPTRQEVVKMTGLVVVVVLIVGVFIYLWDRVLYLMTRRLFE
jgi:preprotein translocase subunit SecE